MSGPAKDDTIAIVTVPDWPRPKGYANGVIGHGRVLHVAGQIAATPDGDIASNDGVVAEFAQALDNVLAVVRAAGGEPRHIASMTVYVTDVEAYYDSPHGLGEAWRERMGKHYPAMAVVGVPRLYERSAHVEIQAVAYLPG
jgi:enamine deaminase RidA (YjgF/YER057c/UK114 family)